MAKILIWQKTSRNTVFATILAAGMRLPQKKRQ
jgi:hypothetical protein